MKRTPTAKKSLYLHLLFVKVPQIHVNLQLLLQNLILFLQEFILNVVFVVVSAAQLRLRHFRNPAPMFTNYTTSEHPEALDQNNTRNGGLKETHTRRATRDASVRNSGIYITQEFYIIYMEQYKCNVVLICYESMSKQCY